MQTHPSTRAWTVSPDARLTFTARAMGMRVAGGFDRMEGRIELDPERLERSSVDITIDATSVTTAMPAFAGVLASSSFLDAHRHPAIRFTSDRIETEADRYRIHGRLRLRDEEREVTIHAAAPVMTEDRLEVRGSAALRGLVADEELELVIDLRARPADAPEVPATPGDVRVPATLAARPTASTGRPLRVLAILGSLRAESLNRRLLETAIEVVGDTAEVEVFDPRDLPLYDGDLEAEGEPPAVGRLKEAVAAADALLVVTPEYNRSLPALAKNVIDWASRRPFSTPLAGKPVGLMGASTGRSGARRALEHARVVLAYTGAVVVDDLVSVPRAQDRLASGATPDPELRSEIQRLFEALGSAAVTTTSQAA